MDIKTPALKKHLSISSLLKTVRHEFEKIPDLTKREAKFSLPDCLMSALAMFQLKYPSLPSALLKTDPSVLIKIDPSNAQ